LLVHEGNTRRKPFLLLAAIITGQHDDVEPISQDRGKDGPGNYSLSWQYCTAGSYLGVRYPLFESGLL